MVFNAVTLIRLSGLAGVLGALITGAGDLLYHHVPGSTQTLAGRMSALPLERLVRAGALGLVGSWFYLFSSLHLYYNFLLTGQANALAIALSFTFVAIAYGVSHSAYYAIASTAMVARENSLDIEAAGKIGAALYNRLVTIAYIPVGIASGLMLIGVLSGRSSYPVWMAVFLPIVPYLLRVPILKILRGRAREIIRDSYDNFILLVFFLLSTLLAWNF